MLKGKIMLKTIKARIVFLSIAVLVLLCSIVFLFNYISYQNTKRLTIIASDNEISNFAREIKQKILLMEAKTTDLAMLGETYYRTNNLDKSEKQLVIDFFEQSPQFLGGGIWFEPYAIKKNTLRKCFYAYRDKDNNVLLDKKFESSEYDYLNQKWYNEIKSQIKKRGDIKWSSPYYEKQGSDTLMITAGSGIYDGDKLIGLSTIDWKISKLVSTLSKMKPTANSFSLFADIDNDFILVSTDPCTGNNDMLGQSLNKVFWYNKNLKGISSFSHHNTRYLSNSKEIGNGLIFIVNIPENELFSSIRKTRMLMAIFLTLAVILVVLITYIVLENNINKPIKSLTETAKLFGQGNIEARNSLKSPEEFARLATTFNQMGENLKQYIEKQKNYTKEKEHIEAELNIASKIQNAALPSYFYPENKEFDIFASMEAAKEVGGDFYDLFFISPEQFVFLIADVSGKGVPAALLMMTVQSMIKHIFYDYKPDGYLISKINNKIIENYSDGIFVTSFIGIVDIKSGKITTINCGHNYPCIKRKDKNFEFFKTDTNIALGAINNFEYNVNETILEPGDTLFLYTDGLTEAMDKNGKFYGDKRLLKSLNNAKNKTPQELINKVKKQVKDFAKETQQSDDCTMLAFTYNGNTDKDNKYNLTLMAKTENYAMFSNWLNKVCTNLDIPQKATNNINLFAEEWFINVADYAYPNKVGDITTNIEKQNNNVIVEFYDEGIKFNPLKQSTPDIDAKLEDRPNGGLGIFLIKQMTDEISYHRSKGKNILRLTIKIK